jgi:regulator of sigma E protease
MTIVLFILLLTFLILIHELGHFIVARWNRVHIEEFGIGLPPKAFTLFHWKGIPFTINWLFLGGFVRMEGEDGSQSEPKIQNPKSKTQQATYPFYARPLLQKIAVVAAGPLVNFLFGFIVFAILFSIYGIPTQIYDRPVLDAIAVDSPAAAAGLQSGDIIEGISPVSSKVIQPVATNQDLITKINSYRGQQVYVFIVRDGREDNIVVDIRKPEDTPEGQGALGIELKSQYEVRQYPLWQRPFRGAVAGFKQSIEFGMTILRSLGGLGRTIASGSVPQDVAGPVGIAAQVQKEGVFSNGLATVFNFAALLSINLGVMNLLPIPALDGGRIVLLILEKIFKGKRWQEISQTLNTAGFIALISLLILITIKDVAGIFFP